MQDLRHAMPALSADACAIAGQAVSLSQWHQVCVCGFETGLKFKGFGEGQENCEDFDVYGVKLVSQKGMAGVWNKAQQSISRRKFLLHSRHALVIGMSELMLDLRQKA